MPACSEQRGSHGAGQRVFLNPLGPGDAPETQGASQPEHVKHGRVALVLEFRRVVQRVPNPTTCLAGRPTGAASVKPDGSDLRRLTDSSAVDAHPCGARMASTSCGTAAFMDGGTKPRSTTIHSSLRTDLRHERRWDRQAPAHRQSVGGCNAPIRAYGEGLLAEEWRSLRGRTIDTPAITTRRPNSLATSQRVRSGSKLSLTCWRRRSTQVTGPPAAQ
jgi:hypothetical protein